MQLLVNKYSHYKTTNHNNNFLVAENLILKSQSYTKVKMKSSVAAVLVAAAGAHAWAGSNITYTTEVVTALTTYCPEATTLTHAGTTYTISEVCS